MLRRDGERKDPSVKRVDSSQWLKTINEGKIPTDPSPPYTEECESSQSGGQRGLRTLPLAKGLFRMIAAKFYMHASISRCISRADASAISADRVFMADEEGQEHPSYGTDRLCYSYPYHSSADS